MKKISIEKELAEDLITSRMHIIDQQINDILLRWGEPNIGLFFEKIARGILNNAEKDGKEMERLLNESDKLKKVLNEAVI